MSSPRVKVLVPHLIERKNSSEVLTMVTAYDSTFASIVDEAGVDLILVGDSVATVMQGQKTTLCVSMEHMEYHVQMSEICHLARIKRLQRMLFVMQFG